jgi:hypothetical protein
MANTDRALSNPSDVRHHPQHWTLKNAASSTTLSVLQDYHQNLAWGHFLPLFPRHYRGMDSRTIIDAKVPGDLDD